MQWYVQSKTVTVGAVAQLVTLAVLTSVAASGHAESLADVSIWRLDNGMTVLFRHNPASQTVAIAGFVRVPITAERDEQAGIRHMVQGMLTHRPSAPDGVDPVEQLAHYGAVVGTSVDYDWTRVTAAGLAENFDSYLSPFREIMLGDQFAWERLNLARSSQQRLLTASRESAIGRAIELAHARLFPGTALARPLHGTEVSVRRLRQSEVRRFYEQHWRPNNMVLSISGPMEPRRCRHQVDTVFGGMLPGTGMEEPRLRLPDVEPAYVHRPWATPNAVVLMLGRAPSPDDDAYAAARVLAAIMAGGQGSLLWHELREQQPLAYAMEASVRTSRSAATFQVMAVCEAALAGDVFEIINGQIGSLRRTPPTTEQVRRAITYLTGNHLLQGQSNLNAADSLGQFEVMQPGRGSELYQSLVSRIEAVTPAQVQQVAGMCTTGAVWVQVGGAPPGSQARFDGPNGRL